MSAGLPSILPRSVYVGGGFICKQGFARLSLFSLKDTHVRLWNIRSVTLVRLSSPAICCIGPGPICVYCRISPVSLVSTLYVIKSPQSSLLTARGTIIACGYSLCFYFIMGSITSLKCVLTQEHLNAVCAKYFVPEEVHPQLPSPDATMHERPTGKVGIYTRFFDYANYRIPFSTFFVSVLVHFRIPFSQLSVFGSAKVSHFEILCRVCNIEPDVGLFRYFYTHNYKNGWFGFTKRPNVRACYSKNLDSVKNWNDHFFWVDEFVVPANARFSWFSGSNITKDRAPAPSEYNVEHVNTLIAQASPFLRFPEEFLCWVGISRNYLLNKDTYPRFLYEDGEEMDLNAFIRTADPRKVRVV
ncbi:hypothetical protein Tco_0754253, partial [Tanacetum coccineum]